MLRLLISETMSKTRSDRLLEFADDITVVGLGSEEASAAAFDIAFFSHDCYRELSADFMAVAIAAPDLRWLQTFSAGIDSPVFTALLESGVRLTTGSGASAASTGRAP